MILYVTDFQLPGSKGLQAVFTFEALCYFKYSPVQVGH